jgi:hypothetical protein
MNVYEEHPTVSMYDLTVDLEYEFPGLSKDAIVHYLRRAADAACRNSDLDMRVLEFETEPGVDSYLLEPPDEAELVAILDVVCLEGADASRIVRRYSGRPERAGGLGVWYTSGDRVLHFSEAPRAWSLYKAEFSVCPAPDACEISARFKGAYYDLLLLGARARIYGLPGRPWFSPDLASVNAARFQKACQHAKVENLLGGQRGRFRVRHRRIL